MANVTLLFKFFGLAFSALLPVINPFGSALLLMALIGNAPDQVFRGLARKIAIDTILFLVVIEVGGTAVLSFFGISLPVIQVAGGLTLAAMGWSLLNQPESNANQKRVEVAEIDTQRLEEEIFYPFTFPITAGPGTIVVMLTLAAHAGVKGTIPGAMAHAGILLATVLLSLLVYVSYAYAPKITHHISAQTAHGILRVIAFVLLCIGVQITWNGVEAMLKTVIRP
ncbi:MAG TPA: MarC family protein [Candidatus Bathyarchaeia archaeon]|nr:MarC family protein [Candidatus Bathyarchaeia archaeon]